MKKYEEEFVKSTARNRMSFIATLAVTEMLEVGNITKDDLIAFVKKNAEEQKHPERAEELIEFIETMDARSFLSQFGWRIYDLKKFHEERKRSREEIRDKHIKDNEEMIRKAREEKAAKKNKGKKPEVKVDTLQPGKKRVVIKMKKAIN